MRLFIAVRAHLQLRLEAAALLLRIVQLGEGVADFHARGVDLETFDEGGVVGFVLRERRHFDRVVVDDGRLQQRVLEMFFEGMNQIEALQLLIADDLAHGGAAKIAEIELLAVVLHHGRAGGIDGRLFQQLRRKVHHSVVIGVSLIELEHRELGVVLRRDALVAEVAVDLVNPIEAAHHQPLQIQLRRDAQV